MHDKDLESAVDRGLRSLPPPRAPETLLPRVLAAAGRPAAKRWYRCPWVEWPLLYQAASVVLLAGLAPLAPFALEWIGTGLAARMAGDAAAGLAIVAADGATLARVLWRVFLEPSVGYLGALVAVMCVSGAACCAALTRVLWEGSVSR